VLAVEIELNCPGELELLLGFSLQESSVDQLLEHVLAFAGLRLPLAQPVCTLVQPSFLAEGFTQHAEGLFLVELSLTDCQLDERVDGFMGYFNVNHDLRPKCKSTLGHVHVWVLFCLFFEKA